MRLLLTAICILSGASAIAQTGELPKSIVEFHRQLSEGGPLKPTPKEEIQFLGTLLDRWTVFVKGSREFAEVFPIESSLITQVEALEAKGLDTKIRELRQIVDSTKSEDRLPRDAFEKTPHWSKTEEVASLLVRRLGGHARGEHAGDVYSIIIHKSQLYLPKYNEPREICGLSRPTAIPSLRHPLTAELDRLTADEPLKWLECAEKAGWDKAGSILVSLARTNEPAVWTRIGELLKSEEELDVRLALICIAQNPRREFFPQLWRLLDSDACYYLPIEFPMARYREHALTHFEQRWNSLSTELKSKVLKVLTYLPCHRSQVLAIKATRDQEPEVRADALELLYELENPARIDCAGPPMEPGLNAVQSLGAYLTATYDPSTVIRSLGFEGIARLQKVLPEAWITRWRQDPAPRIRSALAYYAGDPERMELRPIAISLLGDSDASVRRAAQESIAFDFEDLALLKELIKSKNEAHRLAAATIIDQNPGSEFLHELRPLLTDPSAEVRAAAVGAISLELAPELFATVSALLEDKDQSVRLAAGWTLCYVAEARVTKRLEQSFKRTAGAERASMEEILEKHREVVQRKNSKLGGG